MITIIINETQNLNSTIPTIPEMERLLTIHRLIETIFPGRPSNPIVPVRIRLTIVHFEHHMILEIMTSIEMTPKKRCSHYVIREAPIVEAPGASHVVTEIVISRFAIHF